MTVATRDLGHTHVAQGYHRTWQHLLRTLPIRTRAIVLNRIPATWNWNKKLGISMVLQFGVCISRLSSQHSWYYLHLCCRTWASESNKFKQSQSPTLTTQHHLLQHLEKHGPSGLPGKKLPKWPKSESLVSFDPSRNQPKIHSKSQENPNKISTQPGHKYTPHPSASALLNGVDPRTFEWHVCLQVEEVGCSVQILPNMININKSVYTIEFYMFIIIPAFYFCRLFSLKPNGHTVAVAVQHFSDIFPIAKWPNAPGNTSKSCKLWIFLAKVKLWRPSGHVTLSRLWSKPPPKVKLWRPAGHVTLSRLWLKLSPKVKLWRPSGHVTLSRLWSKHLPKVKLWRPAGHVTLSSLWLNCQPKVKLWRPAGHVTLSRLWSKPPPKVKLWRPAGHVTLSSLWLNSQPKVKLWRPAGHVTLSRLWLNSWPKVKLWRPAGHVTLSRLWLNCQPKVKLWRPAGHVTLSRLWSKPPPKLKLWRPAGHVTLSRLWLKLSPKVKLWRPSGHVTLSRLWSKHLPKGQTLKACWPCHIVQPLIEFPTKSQRSQTLKPCWPCQVVQALIETSSKSQTLKPAGHVRLSRLW